MIMCGLAYTQAEDGHVSIGLLVNRLPWKTQVYIDIFNFLIVWIVLALIAWQSLNHAINSFNANDTSDILGMPFYCIRFIVFVGFLTFALEAFLKFLKSIRLALGASCENMPSSPAGRALGAQEE
jgi:TRAP-type mannitol/chloroaromatic compound transport system permease small subunit